MTDATDHRPSGLPATADDARADEGAGSDQLIDQWQVLRERYLTLVESTLAGTIYEDAPLRASGSETYDPTLREYGWDWPSKAFTMIGLKRLRNLRAVIESVIATNVPGDVMETGVWRGGAGIMARAVLAAYGIGDRRVILADSFAGLPRPNARDYPADAGSVFHEYAELAVPLEEVKRNFSKFGLLDEQVMFVPGLFKDTLPSVAVERLAVLRLDGDMYESSIQSLDNLYDKVSNNGWIVIDDYEVVPACRAAVHDFLKSRDLRPEIYPIDGVGVFFRKTDPHDFLPKSAAPQEYERGRAAWAAKVPAAAFKPANVDFVAWREALMGMIRASEAARDAQQAAVIAHAAEIRAREEARESNEAVARARGEAHALREALAHAGQALNAEVERRLRELERHHGEVARLDREAGQRDHEVARLREQVSVARTEAARLRHDLEVIYASRSWRLGRPYRAFGGALQRLRADGPPSPANVQMPDLPPAPERMPETPSEDQPRAEDDRRSHWPIWLDDNTFVTQRFTYTISKDQFEGLTEKGTVALLKDRKFVELYREFTNELRPQRILEIGFFQGGMPLFLADIAAPEKVVGIDYLQPSEALKSMIADAGWENSVKLHGGILQGDTSTLRQLVDGEFADRPLDLIIDDASHEYENSRVCFQELFGYLRPGGKYVIEDWGWLHWPGEAWQTAKSHFWNKPAMTNLIFELVMTLGSHHPKIISRIEVLSWACVVATRGEGLAHGEPIDLAATRLTSGRRFQPL